MQMASLALTLINSLWVHSFPVNKDLAAFEWSGTLSGERQREREPVANLTVKPPQDIMQPPSCRPNPPRRCGTESAPVQGTRTRRQKKAALLFLIPSQLQKLLQNPMTELSEWLETEPVKSCVPSGPYEWEWVMLLCSAACICFSATSTQYCSLTDCVLTEIKQPVCKTSLVLIVFTESQRNSTKMKFNQKKGIICHLKSAGVSLEVL